MPIYFYKTDGPHGCFSNFAPTPFVLKGLSWKTSEHYFQAQKFAGTEHAEQIRLTKSPMIAAHMGRSRERPLRPDWEKVKNAIMHEAVYAKFSQNSTIRDILLGTGKEEICEKSDKDSYWGIGKDGQGLNMLGKILMQVREELA